MMDTAYFLNNQAKQQILVRHWAVENPNAVIAFCHGQGEHSGRYTHVANFFEKKGLAFMAMDHQGHGKSDGKRGHAPSLDAYLDDIGLFLENVESKYPNKDIVLYGHSMGGLLVLNYTLRRKPKLKALIATSPWIQLAFQPNAAKVVMGKLLRSVLPGLVMPTGLAAEFISRNKETVEKYKNDPLVHGKVSASAGITLMEAGEWLDQHSGEINMPLYMIHGTADKLTSQTASEAFSKRIKGNVTYKKYEGMYHELHNEPEQDVVLQDMAIWIDKILNS